MTRSRYKVFETEYPYFLTCTVVGWLPVFTRPATVQVVLDSWRYLQEHDRLRVYGYVILENHLHLIAASDELSKEIGDFKSYTARRIKKKTGRHMWPARKNRKPRDVLSARARTSTR